MLLRGSLGIRKVINGVECDMNRKLCLLTMALSLVLALIMEPMPAIAGPAQPMRSNSRAAQQLAMEPSGECTRELTAAAARRAMAASCDEVDNGTKMAAPPPPVRLPALCHNRYNNGWQLNRTQACNNQTRRHVYYRRRCATCPWFPVGFKRYRQFDYSWTYPAQKLWFQQQEMVITAIGGENPRTFFFGELMGCSGVCRFVRGNYPTQGVRRVGDRVRGRAVFSSRATSRGSRGQGRTWIKKGYTTPGFVTVPLNPQRTMRPPAVRCDHALPGPSRPGCVFPGHTPVMVYRLNGPYSELARHIRAAQGSGLPARLHRITNAADIDRNRNRACPHGPPWPRPPGKSCDEYPMASTKEGAWTASPRPNPPPRQLRRTFNWCHLRNVPFRTGPRGWSMCMIDEDHNEDGGQALDTTFYKTQRVLNGDPFIVNVH